MLFFNLFLRLSTKEEISTEIIALIVYVIFFTLAIAIVFVAFFVTFQRRKNQLLIGKLEQQKAFDKELVKTQQEIQEQTLNHIGRELHDNVGQMLVYASMQLNSVLKNTTEEFKPKANEALKALKESLEEVRALSKSLNADVIFNFGFEQTLRNEIERLNRLGELTVQLSIEGDKVEFKNKQDQIILFRILQEFYSNSLKYSNATEIKTVLEYSDNLLCILASDNGEGFEIDTVKNGSGLINMERRAQLLNADYKLDSKPNNGTTLKLVYPFRP